MGNLSRCVKCEKSPPSRPQTIYETSAVGTSDDVSLNSPCNDNKVSFKSDLSFDLTVGQEEPTCENTVLTCDDTSTRKSHSPRCQSVPTTTHDTITTDELTRLFSSPDERRESNPSTLFLDLIDGAPPPNFLETEFLGNFKYIVDKGTSRLMLIGSGVCGNVFMGSLINPDGNKTVCIKNVPHKEELVHEYKLLIKLRDTHCVPWVYGLYRTHRDPDHVIDGIVMEYIYPGRTMESALYAGYRLKPINWIRVVLKTARALDTVHECGVLLNDVKTDNLMMKVSSSTHSIDVVIIDLSHATDENGRTFDLVGVDPNEHEEYVHVAPELYEGGRTTRSTDIYGFGRVIRDITDYASVVGPPHHFDQLELLGTMCLDHDPDKRAKMFYINNRLTQLVRMLESADDTNRTGNTEAETMLEASTASNVQLVEVDALATWVDEEYSATAWEATSSEGNVYSDMADDEQNEFVSESEAVLKATTDECVSTHGELSNS